MKNRFFALLGAVLLVSLAQQSHAAVVLSNLDPSNPVFGLNSPVIGEAMLTGNRPISLTSVMFLQNAGVTAGETVAVYSRNADGTLGSALFTGFAVGFDNINSVTTATVTSAFTLQANTGYFFVLNSNSATNLEWSYTSSTDYAAAFGATLPTTNTSFFTTGATTVYRNLAAGPQEFQVNGSAVPEPSACVLMGLALAGGATVLVRRRLTA